MKDKYGIIGCPLGHSFSKKFFDQKFEKENINAEYLNFEISDISQFSDIIKSNPELKGLNVTLPYKEKIIPFLDNLDKEAEEIGAVNVISIEQYNGKTELTGYNSDVIGFQNSISLMLDNSYKKALILGTGGASKAVYQGLKNLNIESKYVSRQPIPGGYTYNDLNNSILDEYTLIINTSPLGMFPNIDQYPDIPYEYLSEKHLLYDLIYNPPITKFLELGNKQGATIKNGIEMLELQAISSWEIWSNK